MRISAIAAAVIGSLLLTFLPCRAEQATSAPASQPTAAAEPDTPAAPSVAHMRLTGIVLTREVDMSLFGMPRDMMTLRAWLKRLAKARTDDDATAVALEIENPLMNWAQAQELADAVRRLREVKPVHAYLRSGGALEYLVASAADELTLEPAGHIWITGVAAELAFFRGTLDKLAIQPQFIQIGRYKGAAEPFTQTAPSDEMAGEHNKIVDDLYNQLCEQIAKQRDMEIDRVRQIIDQGPFTAEQAQQLGLTDRLAGRGEWERNLVSELEGEDEAVWLSDYGEPHRDMPDFSNPFMAFRVMFKGPQRTRSKGPTIAIIYADGLITGGRSGESFFGQRLAGAKTLTRCFRQAARDPNVKAVVFRIDSPGGSALASEMIYQAARQCAADKPVVASIARMAASGGYYIAVGADKIVADPSAIVGSIGVIGGKLAIVGLLDKLGINLYQIKRGQNAGMWTSSPWSETQQEAIRRTCQRTYDIFVNRVATSRAGKIADISAVAQGRIFTARQAVDNRLIDQVGGMRDAVLAAQAAAGIESFRVLELPEPRTLADVLFGNGGASGSTGSRASVLRGVGPASVYLAAIARRSPIAYLLDLAALLDSENVLTALPYYISVQP